MRARRKPMPADASTVTLRDYCASPSLGLAMFCLGGVKRCDKVSRAQEHR
jgi:hypothetical protein